MNIEWIEWFVGYCEEFIFVNPFTMIFAWANLLILFIVMSALVFKPIKKMIDTRQKEVDDMYENAEVAVKDAEAMRTDYEAKLAAANEESEEILKRAVRRAQLREEEILKEADAKAERVMERAEEQIELERRRAVNDVKNEVSAMAVGIAAAVIERDVNADEHKALIDDFIKRMGE